MRFSDMSYSDLVVMLKRYEFLESLPSDEYTSFFGFTEYFLDEIDIQANEDIAKHNEEIAKYNEEIRIKRLLLKHEIRHRENQLFNNN